MEQQAQAEQRLTELAAERGRDRGDQGSRRRRSSQIAQGAGADEEAELTAKYDAARAALTIDEIAALRLPARIATVASASPSSIGLRCDGCHLDLSQGEVDGFKRLPPGELVECPQCGRVLVR